VEATSHCALLRKPPQVERTFRLLEQAASDPSTAVRTCVISSLGPLLKDDDLRTLSIFERTLEGHPVLLQSPLVHRFLYWIYHDHFLRIRPFVEASLDDGDENTRQAGARLACLAAFRYPEASKLAERAINGDVAMRRGAAQVYAHNLAHPDYEVICQEHLRQLMHDLDEQVRTHVGECFLHLRAEHLDRLCSFIEAFLLSPALLAGARSLVHFVNYMKSVAAEEHDLALRVTSRILEVAGDEVVDIRTSWALLEQDLASLPLTVYMHADDLAIKSRAMETFERLLLLGSRVAQQALADWDRR
jgi:hypothetical protein